MVVTSPLSASVVLVLSDVITRITQSFAATPLNVTPRVLLEDAPATPVPPLPAEVIATYGPVPNSPRVTVPPVSEIADTWSTVVPSSPKTLISVPSFVTLLRMNL
jgi:hypothetical protein